MKIKLFPSLLIVILLYLLFQGAWLYYYIQIGKRVVAESEKFERLNPNASMRILVIGDSTAFGVGASTPETSLAGLYGQRFPEAEIQNLGVNGMKTGQLKEQLQALQEERYDLIQLHIGGNDIIRLVSLEDISKNIHEILELATSMADQVVFASSGNIGTAKLFPSSLRPILERRTRDARDIFFSASSKFETVSYVDLFREKRDDPFASNPDLYYSDDFLHPSSEGYADWWEFISLALNDIYEN